ncbi:MAG: M23 family metallopeptidase [Candidatus Latescibacter sp.]|nr:M23 family metallopeptidase [Candidatus Latescibacter sp.]
MRSHLFLLLFCIGSLNTVSFSLAEDFIWPIDAKEIITSTFAEPRPGRFHFGVDFTSDGVIGKRVYAPSEGFISKAATSPFGYGKMLCFTLDSGKTVVFAHLSRFLPVIEERLEDLREKEHSWDVELTLKPQELRARKGEVICWSGNSGNSTPHLHMELKDSDDTLLNILGQGLTTTDSVPPEIGDVLLVPLDRNSSVDSSPLPVRYNPRSGEKLHLTGRIGVVAAFSDRLGESLVHTGIYSASLTVDSTMVFSKTYDRLLAQENSYGGLDYLSGDSYGARGILSALFRRDGNPLEFYRGDGLLFIFPSFPAKQHILRVEAADFSGNHAEKTLTVVYGARPVFTACEFMPGGILRVGGKHSADVLDRVEIWKRNGAVWKLDRSIPAGEKECDIRESMGDNPMTCKVFLIARDTSRSLPCILRYDPLSQNSQDKRVINLNVKFLHDRAVIFLTASGPLASLPSFWFIETGGRKKELTMTPTGETSWIAGIPLVRMGQSALFINVRARSPSLRESVTTEFVNYTLVDTAFNGEICSSDSSFSLRVSPGAVYRPVPVKVTKAETDTPEGFTVISPVYRVQWGDEPIKSSAAVTFRLSEEPPADALIYAGGDRGRWHCLSGQIRGKNFSARFKGSGCVAVLVDSIAPVVLAVSPRPGSLLTARRPEIAVRVRDNESGLAGSDSISLTVDSQPVYGEYMPASDLVRYMMRKNLPSGRHEVQAKATDRAGNTKSIAWQFTVR